jgi:hypothetical protein
VILPTDPWRRRQVTNEESRAMLHRYARHAATLIAVVLLVSALLVALMRG